MGKRDFEQLLDKLNINKGNVIFLHSSFSRLKYLELTPQELLTILLQRLGSEGTLAMPSYTWHLDPQHRPWKGYKDYFELRPAFDVKNTPSNLGWIPETFRLMKGTKRSLDYWWSIGVQGALAEYITQNQEILQHSYGQESSFEKLMLANVKILGLGVTLNTTSLAPMVDFALGSTHPHQIFTTTLERGLVIDFDGKAIQTHKYWLLPDVVHFIKPEQVFYESPNLQTALQRADFEDTIHFSYPFQTYYAEALHLGYAASSEKRNVPWLLNYPLKNELNP